MASLKSMIVSYIVVLSLFHFEFSNAVIKGGYWSPQNELDATDIDSTLFTHLFCTFAELETQTPQLKIPDECKTFPQTIKQKNSGVKAVLSIGGGEASSSDLNAMASQASSRAAFIKSSISLATSYGYDGLDLDWENQTSMVEFINLAALLNEWKTAIKAQAPNLILTAALHVTPKLNSVPYPPRVISSISTNLDWGNVMAYDFYMPSNSPSQLTRPSAALYEPNPNGSNGVSGSGGIDAWIKAGVPANKLVLGFPFYGTAWQLVNPNDHGILAKATTNKDVIINGKATPTPKYRNITQLISSNNAQVVYNSSYVSNYFYFGTTWIAYDGTQTIQAKVAYAKKTGLNGYFAWQINQDDNWALSKQASQAWGS